MLSRYFDEDILAVNQALPELEAVDPRAVSLIELRFFCGLSLEATAQALGCTVAQAEQEWAVAKAWLRRALDADDPVSTGQVDGSKGLQLES